MNEIPVERKEGALLEAMEIHEKDIQSSLLVSESSVTESPQNRTDISEPKLDGTENNAPQLADGTEAEPDHPISNYNPTEATTENERKDHSREEETDETKSTATDDESMIVMQHEPRPVNLGVRYYNYQGFVNRMKDDGWDYTIEVLVAKPRWSDDVLEERKRRKALDDGGVVEKAGHITNLPQMVTTSEKLGEGQRICRVRIRSQVVLRHLAELGEWDEKIFFGDGIVFCRPFWSFLYYQEDMKRKLKEMETEAANISEVVGSSTVQSVSPTKEKNEDIPPGSSPDNKTLSSSDSAPDAVSCGATPLEEMQCYVDFVEATILPLWRRFEKIDKQTPRKITHDEIPFLFRPGELMYVPSSPTTVNALQRSALQNVFRMGYCIPQDTPYEFEDNEWSVADLEKTKWSFYCIDHDGEKFKAIWYRVRFNYFEGEREVTSLECYPLRFHPHYDAILKHQIETGTRFKSFVEEPTKYQYYSGWTLVTGMFQKRGDSDESEGEPEHIESEVIIDMKEAARHMLEWQPNDTPNWDASWRVESDQAATFRVWLNTLEEKAQYDEKPVQMMIREDFAYITAAKKYHDEENCVKDDLTFSRENWTNDDLAILPKRLLGYVLRERKFARLDVNKFELTKEEDKTTLDNIQMKNEHRTIIRSTVTSHFLTREREKNNITSVYNPDIIKGKGRGVVILLHGAPGVGKTATAEAVALENKKPLFPITCGDLGTSAEDVERTLKDIFRYAHMWDCILLLDEADVFLTQRDRTDVERNALVSVFLRVLEYYSGILFLTTNRVGALDEAFRSRVHISLYYRHLTCEDTLAILKGSLSRLPRADKLPNGISAGDAHIQVMDKQIENFIETEYKKHSKVHHKGPWNGRQIRNAVQIATCLAFFEKQSQDEENNLPAVLTSDHFRTVADTTAEFDRYLKKARRADEAKMAHMQGDRYDEYESDHTHEPVQYEGFTSSREPSMINSGRKVRPSAESQGTGRGSARSMRAGTRQSRPQQPAASNARYTSYGQDFGGYHNSSERKAADYRTEDMDDDEDDHDTSLRTPAPGRGSWRGGSGELSQTGYRSSTHASHGADANDTADMDHLDEDNHQEWDENPELQQGSQKAKSPNFGKERRNLWGSGDSRPASDGRARNYGADDTPSRAQRRGADAGPM